MEIIERDERKRFERGRFIFITILFIFVFFILTLRLFYLQVIMGDRYYTRTVENAVKLEVIKAPRGLIKDRNGSILADVRPSFDCTITPGLMSMGDDEKRSIKEEFELLHRLLSIPLEEVKNKYIFGLNSSRFKPLVLKSDLSWEEVSRVQGHRFFLPGVDIRVSKKRIFNYGEIFCHTIGYIAEVSKEELKRFSQDPNKDYEMGDLIGRAGVEKLEEENMRGKDGFRYLIVDAMGREYDPEKLDAPDEYIELLLENIRDRRRDAVPGKDIFLTLDLELQRFIHSIFQGKEGVIIAMDPRNGDILASISSPQYDPEPFSRGLTKQEWESLINNPFHPLEDKTTRGQYSPGSTFKPFIALMGLAEGVVSERTKFVCNGVFRLGRSKFRCWSWKMGGHGVVDLDKALYQSCDIYFYNLALRLGIDRIVRYAREFGFGDETGIGLNNEKRGVLPSPQWKKTLFSKDWTSGETILVSIGQSYNLVTPIQLATAYSSLINGGYLNIPRIVKSIEGKGEVPTRLKRKISIKNKDIKPIINALYHAVSRPDGTAKLARVPFLKSGGKTGTAQLVKQEVKDLLKGNVPIKDHAWYVGFAPLDDPSLLLVILVEHGGYGGVSAAPLAKKIFEWYFRHEIERNRTLARRGVKKKFDRASIISNEQRM